MNPSLTREQFISAIESAIERAGFDDETNAKLREVGRTATKAARGGYFDGNVCCPLACCGFTGDEEDESAEDETERFSSQHKQGEFFAVYDRETAHLLGVRATTFEVID